MRVRIRAGILGICLLMNIDLLGRWRWLLRVCIIEGFWILMPCWELKLVVSFWEIYGWTTWNDAQPVRTPRGISGRARQTLCRKGKSSSSEIKVLPLQWENRRI